MSFQINLYLSNVSHIRHGQNKAPSLQVIYWGSDKLPKMIGHKGHADFDDV